MELPKLSGKGFSKLFGGNKINQNIYAVENDEESIKRYSNVGKDDKKNDISSDQMFSSRE